MEQETKRTVQIKLKPTPEQVEEIEKLFLAFKIGLNFCLEEIEKAYQKTASEYVRLKYGDTQGIKGECAGCHKEKVLAYRSKDGNANAAEMYCSSCVMRNYSEYTVRTSIISTKDREVKNDLKAAVQLENQTHFHMIFSQAYANWKSFDAWRKKREYERDRLKKELSDLENDKKTSLAFKAANLIWLNAAHMCRQDKKITRLRAMAVASKDVYSIYPNLFQRDISRIVNKIRRLNSLSRPVRFPKYDAVQAVQMHNNFVKFKDGKLHMSLFYKKLNQQAMDFYSNKYLNQFLSVMEEDNAVYTNLIKRIDGKKISYYLMYRLTVKQNIPTIFDLADVFTVCFSPDRVLVHYRQDGIEKVRWWKLGWLVDRKTHVSDKRRELQEHNTRNSLRRIKKMGNAEQRATRTFNHQLSHDIVDWIAGRSDNPLIVMWDIGTGITADYGKKLNLVKRTWPVVQQQEFIKHKAFLRCVPVKMFPYKEVNDLACSFCGAKFRKKDEMGKATKESVKTITAILRKAKNIRCENCGRELNLLINQARGLEALPLNEKKGNE